MAPHVIAVAVVLFVAVALYAYHVYALEGELGDPAGEVEG
jgi:hypothetical protein